MTSSLKCFISYFKSIQSSRIYSTRMATSGRLSETVYIRTETLGKKNSLKDLDFYKYCKTNGIL